MFRIHEHGESSNYGRHQNTRSRVSSDYSPTLTTTRKIIRGHKNRSLRLSYEQEYEVDQVSIFSLIAYNPLIFEEVVKEEF